MLRGDTPLYISCPAARKAESVSYISRLSHSSFSPSLQEVYEARGDTRAMCSRDTKRDSREIAIDKRRQQKKTIEPFLCLSRPLSLFCLSSLLLLYKTQRVSPFPMNVVYFSLHPIGHRPRCRMETVQILSKLVVVRESQQLQQRQRHVSQLFI